ncbi:MAG TPA: site-specific integrase [Firmicutes bacterium]|nr:site-specific integrase [Bacillota bacterium]
MGKSLLKQATAAIRSIQRFGWSLHDLKKLGDSERWITSKRTARNTMYNIKGCVRWIQQEYGLSWIKDIRPSHVQAYIDDKVKTGQWTSAYQIKRFITDVKRLGYGIKQQYGYTRCLVPSQGFSLPDQLRERRIADRKQTVPYSEKKALAVIALVKKNHTSDRYGVVWRGLECVNLVGLRVSELTHIQVRDLLPSQNAIHIRGKAVHAKGGKIRTAIAFTAPADYIAGLKAWCLERGLRPTDRVFPRSTRTFERWERRARRAIEKHMRQPGQSIHGLRGSYYNSARQAGIPDQDIARSMGHEREAIGTSYRLHQPRIF